MNFCNYNAMMRAKSIRKEMAHQLKYSVAPGQSFQSCGDDDHETILKCLLSGFFFNIVQKVKGDFAYKTINDPRIVKFDKKSVLEQFPTLEPPEWLMYYDAYDCEDGEGEVIYQLSIVPDVRWIVDAAPHFYKIKHSKHSFHGESQDYLKDFIYN